MFVTCMHGNLISLSVLELLYMNHLSCKLPNFVVTVFGDALIKSDKAKVLRGYKCGLVVIVNVMHGISKAEMASELSRRG